MINTIIFDLGQVIVSFDWMPALQHAAQHTDKSLEEIVVYFSDFKNDHLFVEGKMSGQEFYDQVQSVFNFSLSLGEFRDLYNSIFSPMPETDDVISKLSQHYRLALLSNTNEFHFPYVMEEYPILNYFDECIVSYEAHCQKPHPQIYQKTLERLDVRPQQALFIDDNEENVNAATQLGIRGIHFTGTESLLAGLEKYGVQGIS